MPGEEKDDHAPTTHQDTIPPVTIKTGEEDMILPRHDEKVVPGYQHPPSHQGITLANNTQPGEGGDNKEDVKLPRHDEDSKSIPGC